MKRPIRRRRIVEEPKQLPRYTSHGLVFDGKKYVEIQSDGHGEIKEETMTGNHPVFAIIPFI